MHVKTLYSVFAEINPLPSIVGYFLIVRLSEISSFESQESSPRTRKHILYSLLMKSIRDPSSLSKNDHILFLYKIKFYFLFYLYSCKAFTAFFTCLQENKIRIITFMLKVFPPGNPGYPSYPQVPEMFMKSLVRLVFTQQVYLLCCQAHILLLHI